MYTNLVEAYGRSTVHQEHTTGNFTGQNHTPGLFNDLPGVSEGYGVFNKIFSRMIRNLLLDKARS